MTQGIVVLVVVLLLFLVGRELVCWYWKINAGIALLQGISDSHKQYGIERDKAIVNLLSEINEKLGASSAPNGPPPLQPNR